MSIFSVDLYQCYPNLFFLADPFWLRIMTTDSHILARVNIVCPDDRYPEFKICVSELILDSHEYIPVAYVIMTLIKLSLASWVQGVLLVRYSNGHTQ
jgi:hypothetical protein